MSQHDYNIANQTFSATRTDLNNALGAVATNNAGNSAPSTTYANQWWFDSDGNQLYQRNKDNDAWVKILTIGATSDKVESIADSIAIASTGGVTITTADNTDTLSLISTDADALVGPVLRLFRNSASPADDDVIGNLIFSGQDGAGNETDFLTFQVNAGDVANGAEDGFMRIMMPVASASTEFIRMSAGGVVFNEGGVAGSDFRVESDSNTHMLFVDGGDDDVRIGTATSFSNNEAGLRVKGGITIGDFSADSASNTLMFIKSRNTTVGSQTIVAADDEVGRIAFKADDGDDSNYNNNVAAIFAQIDGTPGTNDTPGRLIFETTADGARVGTERVRIHSNGVASFNNGIALGVGTANTASNVLDDYEEGTFAYTITGSTSGNLVIRSGYTRGSYVKIGNLVNVNIRFETTSDNSLSGNVYWSLPFTMANPNGSDADAAVAVGYIRDNAMGADAQMGTYQLSEGNAFVYYLFSREANANSTTELANNSNTDGIMEGVVSITYRTT